MGKTVKDKKDILAALKKSGKNRADKKEKLATLFGKITLREDPVEYQHRVRDWNDDNS
ncbi:MAG: hypothetical protein NXI08_13310 [bacterium]|jgi:hypothetical protein|nr:hypothetical protein [bacterium]